MLMGGEGGIKQGNLILLSWYPGSGVVLDCIDS